EDADELAEQKAARGRRLRGVVIAEVLILAFGLGAPWVLTRKTESTQQHAARLMRERLEAQVKQDPNDETAARELARALWAEGKTDEAQKLEAKQAERLRAKADARLAAQLSALDQNPADEPALLAALEALDEAGRTDDAKKRYE